MKKKCIYCQHYYLVPCDKKLHVDCANFQHLQKHGKKVSKAVKNRARAK